MRGMYVIDASVALKPVLQEEDADKVEKLFYLKDQFEIMFLVPDIFSYEFMNNLSRSMPATFARKAFEILTEKQVSIIPLELDLMNMADRLVQKYQRISFYDAVYHALAKAYNTDLITADEQYYELTKREGNIKLLKNLKI